MKKICTKLINLTVSRKRAVDVLPFTKSIVLSILIQSNATIQKDRTDSLYPKYSQYVKILFLVQRTFAHGSKISNKIHFPKFDSKFKEELRLYTVETFKEVGVGVC